MIVTSVTVGFLLYGCLPHKNLKFCFHLMALLK